MFERIAGQARIQMSVVQRGDGSVKILRIAEGLDFTAALALAEKMGADNLLFLELLPEIEAFVVRGINRGNE